MWHSANLPSTGTPTIDTTLDHAHQSVRSLKYAPTVTAMFKSELYTLPRSRLYLRRIWEPEAWRGGCQSSPWEQGSLYWRSLGEPYASNLHHSSLLNLQTCNFCSFNFTQNVYLEKRAGLSDHYQYRVQARMRKINKKYYTAPILRVLQGLCLVLAMLTIDKTIFLSSCLFSHNNYYFLWDP